MPWLLYICIFFSDIMCFDMSLLLLTVTLRGVSNKHCLLPLFSFVSDLYEKIHKKPFRHQTITVVTDRFEEGGFTELMCPEDTSSVKSFYILLHIVSFKANQKMNFQTGLLFFGT